MYQKNPNTGLPSKNIRRSTTHTLPADKILSCNAPSNGFGVQVKSRQMPTRQGRKRTSPTSLVLFIPTYFSVLSGLIPQETTCTLSQPRSFSLRKTTNKLFLCNVFPNTTSDTHAHNPGTALAEQSLDHPLQTHEDYAAFTHARAALLQSTPCLLSPPGTGHCFIRGPADVHDL